MDPVVRTSRGAVRGRTMDGVSAFKGIPYAAPPFGPARFAAPRPAAAWSGVRDAGEFGPTAPLSRYFPPYDRLFPEPIIPGEECLNLNVWTPDADTSGLPVMVWLHGGAFVNGSAAVPTYDGTSFAQHGVVLVSLNYRLGADGFLFFEDGPNNRGLLDQLAALEWVQEEIASFGGDPGRVTVFGESAGALSVGVLMATPRSEGLFHRAILQSGAGHLVLTPPSARLVAGELGKQLGVEPTREALAATPVARLIAAQVALQRAVVMDPNPQRWGEVVANMMPFEPVIDGDLLIDLPIRVLAAGASRGLEVLAGTNTEEHRLFLVPTGVSERIADEGLARYAAACGLDPESALSTYRAGRPDGTPGEILADVLTDWIFRIPVVRLAEARAANGGRVWQYEFAWGSPQFDGRLGACHALELAFVFDTLNDRWTAPLAGEHPPQELADAMHGAWVRFAETGDPGWSRYEPSRRAVMRFDVPVELVEDPRRDERALWDGIR